MSIYSRYEVYPSEFDNVPEATNCYNCDNDCPGIILDIFRQVDPQTIFNMQFLISEKLAEKGYGAVNLCYEKINGNPQHVLQFSYTEVDKFVENMNRLGYPCKSVPAHKRRYRFVVFENATPMDLLHVYHYLDVIE